MAHPGEGVEPGEGIGRERSVDLEVEIVAVTDGTCASELRFQAPWAAGELVVAGPPSAQSPGIVDEAGGGAGWRPLDAALADDSRRRAAAAAGRAGGTEDGGAPAAGSGAAKAGGKPQAGAKGKGKAGAKEKDAKAGAGAATASDGSAQGPARLVWRKTWGGVQPTDDWALRLADDPWLVVWGGAAGESARPAQLYSFCLPLDVSSLFAPARSDSDCRPGASGPTAAAYLQSTSAGPLGGQSFRASAAGGSSDSSDSDEGQAMGMLGRSPAAGELPSSLSPEDLAAAQQEQAARQASEPQAGVRIGLPIAEPGVPLEHEAKPEPASAEAASEASLSDAAGARQEALLAAREWRSRPAVAAPCPSPPLPPGLASLQVRVRASGRLLSSQQERRLNPLVIDLDALRSLPGLTVVGRDPGLAETVRADRHAALRDECRPLQVAGRLFGSGALALADGADSTIAVAEAPTGRASKPQGAEPREPADSSSAATGADSKLRAKAAPGGAEGGAKSKAKAAAAATAKGGKGSAAPSKGGKPGASTPASSSSSSAAAAAAAGGGDNEGGSAQSLRAGHPPRGKGGCERLLLSHALPQGAEARLAYRAVVLLGAVPVAVARERLRAGGLAMRVLDRVAGDGMIAAGVLGRTRMPGRSGHREGRGGSAADEAPAASAAGSSRGVRALPAADAPAGAAPTRTKTWAAELGELEEQGRAALGLGREDAVELAGLEETLAAALAAADARAWSEALLDAEEAPLLHPHGEATLRLDGFTERTGEQLRALHRAGRRRAAAELAERKLAQRRFDDAAAARKRRRLAAIARARGSESAMPADDEPPAADGSVAGGSGADAGQAVLASEPSASGPQEVASGTDSATDDDLAAGPGAGAVGKRLIPRGVAGRFSAPVEARARQLLPQGGEPREGLSRLQLLARRPGAFAAAGSRLLGRLFLRRPVATSGYEGAADAAVAPSGTPQHPARADDAGNGADEAAAVDPWAPEPLGRFGRLVLVSRYNEDSEFRAALAAAETAGKAALPGAASLHAHTFSADEADDANNGGLDVVTGFQVADDNWRVLVLEGLLEAPAGGSGRSQGQQAGQGQAPGALARVRAAVGEAMAPSSTRKLLFSPDVRFARRIYTGLGPMPRSFRLRELLATTMKSPALYSAARAPAGAAAALRCLWELRRAPSLAAAAAADVFPAASGVEAVARYFGAAVTLADMYGTGWEARADDATVAAVKAAELGEVATEAALPALADAMTRKQGSSSWAGHTAGRLAMLATASAAQLQGAPERGAESKDGHGEQAGGAQAATGRARRSHEPRKPPTDSKNSEYERARRENAKERMEMDALARHAAEVAQASAALTAAKEAVGESRAQVRALPPEIEAAMQQPGGGGHAAANLAQVAPGGRVFAYSGQRMSTLDWHRSLQRDRLVADKGAVFSHSLAFGQATVSLADDAGEGEAARRAHREKLTVPQGFVYPAPRAPAEYAKHPWAPHPARAEDLRAPFLDSAEADALQRAAERAAAEATGKAPLVVPTRAGARAGTGDPGFGFTDPRTGQHADAEFYRSVHTGGDGLEAEQEAAKAAERRDWERRVVVSDPVFRVHSGPGRPAQADRARGGLLAGRPQKLAAKMAARTRLPSGRVVRGGLRAPGRDITGQDEYTGGAGSASLPPGRGSSRDGPAARPATLAKGAGTAAGLGLLRGAGRRAIESANGAALAAAEVGATLASTRRQQDGTLRHGEPFRSPLAPVEAAVPTSRGRRVGPLSAAERSAPSFARGSRRFPAG
ncbi:unnamed protein product, partial [Symbiodinium sp. KB8]